MKTHINGNTIEQIMTNVVTLTQLQYDQLPNEQKLHGTYIISDSDSPGISATNVSYSTGVSVKDKLDEKASPQLITDITITNSVGGTETNKARLYYTGNVGILDIIYKCQNATNETITFGLPTGWWIQRGGIALRDNDNGNLILAWGSPTNTLSTFNHTGTMTVGHMMWGTAMCYKIS